MRRKCERITRKFRTCPGRFAHRFSCISTFFVWFRPFAAPKLTVRILVHTTHDCRREKIKRREPEELEAEREETDDEVPGGRGSSSVFTSSSSSSDATETHGGSGVSLPDIFPEGVSFPFGASGFPAGFPFGEWLGGGGDARSPASPPSFFGAMAAAFRGMYEIAREMERLEKGEETRRRAADPKETTPAARGDDE